MNKELKRVNISEITPYENNPRRNDGAVEAVMESIKQCEYIAPIIVDEDGVILAGHTRLKALQALGRTEADILVIKGLNPAQKQKYRLLDNKTGELSAWDNKLLEIELDNLDFNGYDFEWITGDYSGDGFFEEDDREPKEKKPKTVTCPCCGREIEL